VTEDSSFSEEKEAKRLLVLGRLHNACQAITELEAANG
jgi:hypothetical protein